MKTKVYRLFRDQEELIATFESRGLAEQYAHLIDDVVAWDVRLVQGRKQQTVRSRLHNTCPGCGAHWTYQEMWHGEKWGTHRCDCGVLFEIDWRFEEGKLLAIVDRDTVAWAEPLDPQERRQV